LVPCLRDRFSVVGEFPAGGEANVLLVTEPGGARWVVKQYRRAGWAPSPDVLDRVAGLKDGQTRSSWATDPVLEHLVWIEQWGIDPDTGLFYEVQEYLPGGDLDRFTAPGATGPGLSGWDPHQLVGALADMLEAFGRTIGAHRDIKPGNVLARTTPPGAAPVLALGDIGLARDVGEDSHRFSRREGSAAYQAPEAAHGTVSRAGDWWAVGMMTAHAALGTHPLALPDGSLPDEQALHADLAQRDVPLQAITDARLQLLCSGLLTRDSTHRWRLAEVRAWQAGQTPPVTPTTSAPARTRSVSFHGTEHTTPQALAAAFAADFERAGTALFAQRDPVLREDTLALLRAHHLDEALHVISSYTTGAWEPTLLRLLAEMDPQLAPRINGIDVTPTGIATLATTILNTDTTPTHNQTLITTLILDHQLWRYWRHLPGMRHANTAADRLIPTNDIKTALTQAGLDNGRRDSPARLLLTPDGTTTWAQPGGHTPGDELLSRDTVTAYWATAWPKHQAWRLLDATDPDHTHAQLDRILTQATRTLHNATSPSSMEPDTGSTSPWTHSHLDNLWASFTPTSADAVPAQMTWWTTLATDANPAHRITAATTTGLAATAQQTAHQQGARQRQQAQARGAAQARERLAAEERERAERVANARAANAREQVARRKRRLAIGATIFLGGTLAFVSWLPSWLESRPPAPTPIEYKATRAGQFVYGQPTLDAPRVGRLTAGTQLVLGCVTETDGTPWVEVRSPLQGFLPATSIRLTRQVGRVSPTEREFAGFPECP
jgi:serine/threonine protein kinase